MTTPRSDTMQRDDDAMTFIRQYIHEHGYPPTRTEIAAAMDLGSKTQAQRIINRLVAQGLIETTTTARGIRVKRGNTKALTEEL